MADAHRSTDERFARLERARAELKRATEALNEAEREYGAASRDVHAKDCRYFNGMDMTCTCGADP